MATNRTYICYFFVYFYLWRALTSWSSHEPSQAHYLFGWFLHQQMKNNKYNHLCFCQRHIQGTSNVNHDFWQTCPGMREGGEGERHSFSVVFFSLSCSQFITGQLMCIYICVWLCSILIGLTVWKIQSAQGNGIFSPLFMSSTVSCRVANTYTSVSKKIPSWIKRKWIQPKPLDFSHAT